MPTPVLGSIEVVVVFGAPALMVCLLYRCALRPMPDVKTRSRTMRPHDYCPTVWTRRAVPADRRVRSAGRPSLPSYDPARRGLAMQARIILGRFNGPPRCAG